MSTLALLRGGLGTRLIVWPLSLEPWRENRRFSALALRPRRGPLPGFRARARVRPQVCEGTGLVKSHQMCGDVAERSMVVIRSGDLTVTNSVDGFRGWRDRAGPPGPTVSARGRACLAGVDGRRMWPEGFLLRVRRRVREQEGAMGRSQEADAVNGHWGEDRDLGFRLVGGETGWGRWVLEGFSGRTGGSLPTGPLPARPCTSVGRLWQCRPDDHARAVVSQAALALALAGQRGQLRNRGRQPTLVCQGPSSWAIHHSQAGWARGRPGADPSSRRPRGSGTNGAPPLSQHQGPPRRRGIGGWC